MAQLTVVSRRQHADKRWKRSDSYGFTSEDSVAPLVMQELPRACLSLPVGFIQTDGSFKLVAIQGLQQNKNLYVAPDGHWLGAYIPAAYRSYPFALANTEDKQQILCIREESGLVSDTDGEVFFNADGKPTSAVKEILTFLQQLATSAQQTINLCELLTKHDLIQPWNIQVKAHDETHKIRGLYSVDEIALNALPIEAFNELRQNGALPLIYCQLLSMQHLHSLGKINSRNNQGNGSLTSEDGELDLEFLHNDGMLRYS